MIDFTALQQLAAIDAGTLRRELDPRYVLHVHGHRPAAEESGRVLYHSPFRPDSKPSYTVRRDAEGVWRCGDLAQGREGDVLDLISELPPSPCSFVEATLIAEQYLKDMREAGWTAPLLTAAPPREVLEDQVVEVIRSAPLTALTSFLNSREGCLAAVPPEFLRWHYGVAEIGPDLLIPYTDRYGKIRALKRRAPGEGTKSLPGFSYGDLLYGEHLLSQGPPDLPVVLCEGETDVWAAAYWPGLCVVPLGVPTGAGRPPTESQLALLQGREVYVCFDADPAGDAGAELWPFPRLRPPEGKDLAGLTVEELRGLMP